MLTLVRIVLGLTGLVAGWFVSYWVCFVQFDRDGAAFMGRGAPFLVGLAVAVIIVAATEHLRHGYLSATILGALLLGGTIFLLGLLGLPASVPGSVLLGGLLGALWWWLRSRRDRAT